MDVKYSSEENPVVQRACVDAKGRFVFSFSEHDRSTLTMMIEAGGAVTFCEGVTTPQSCLLTCPPARVRSNAKVAASMMLYLTDFVQTVVHNRQAVDSFESTWLDEWCDKMSRLGLAPLYWEPDSAQVVAAWSRNVAMRACPVVPGAAMSVDGPDHRPSPVSATATALAAIRDAGMSARTGLNPVRASLSPVLLWTPSYLAFLTDRRPCPREVTGFAWATRPGQGQQGLAAVIPQMDVYEWSAPGDGFFTYTRLPRARELQPSPGLTQELPIDGRLMAVRRLMVLAGHMDARAAHVQSIQLAETARAQAGHDTVPLTVEDRIGPGPQTFPVSAVPPSNGQGALAAAAAASQRLAQTAQSCHDIACSLGGAGSPPILSESLLGAAGQEDSTGHEACQDSGSQARSQEGMPTASRLAMSAASSLLREQEEWEAGRLFRLQAATVAAQRRLRATTAAVRQIDMTLA